MCVSIEHETSNMNTYNNINIIQIYIYRYTNSNTIEKISYKQITFTPYMRKNNNRESETVESALFYVLPCKSNINFIQLRKIKRFLRY